MIIPVPSNVYRYCEQKILPVMLFYFYLLATFCDLELTLKLTLAVRIFLTASEKLIPEGSYIPGVLAVAWNLQTAGHFSNCRLWSVASLCALVDGGRPLMFFSLIFLWSTDSQHSGGNIRKTHTLGIMLVRYL